MASETLKQRQEQLMAACLQEALGLDVRSTKSCDPPCADISWELASGELIAVEVRGLTFAERRESVATKARVGKAAEAELCGCRIDAHVLWESDITIPPAEAKRLGKAIAREVRAMLASGRTTLGELDEMPKDLLPYAGMLFLAPPTSERPRVRTGLESWTGRGSPDVIQAALDDKQARLEAYRRAHPGAAVWLLLWTSAGESQPVSVRMLDKDHVYRSSFDEVFVLDYPRREVSKLTLAPAR